MVERNSRPKYHIVAPRGFMNDPCGPGYDPITKLYHLSYQWNPHSVVWDNISWGHMTSPDLITWTQTSNEPSIIPGEPYDRGGIYTGCFYADPSDGSLTCFYTSVNQHPHWEKEHVWGSETLSAVKSTDEGKTWVKSPHNPILAGEPEGLKVTGWRDPFVSPWPSVDTARSRSRGSDDQDTAETMYALISGGFPGVGPTTFLYTFNRRNILQWEYLGPLVLPIAPDWTPDKGKGGAGDTKWARSLGRNWECTTFATLHSLDGSVSRDVVMPSSEGGSQEARLGEYHRSHPKAPVRTPRSASWILGRITLETKTAEESDDTAMPPPTSELAGERRHPVVSPETFGLLDWGILYACSIFTAPDGRVVQWGWAIEEDVHRAYLEEKGWTGCLGIPRELFLFTLNDVIGMLATPLRDIASVETVPLAGNGPKRVVTMGIRPIKEIEQLRRKKLYRWTGSQASVVPPQGSGRSIPLLRSSSPTQEINLVADVTADSIVTLVIRQDPASDTQTTVSFDSANETITVRRAHSTKRDDIHTADEFGSHTLFRTEQGLETLRLRVFLDQDLIEVFANDRFSLTTRVYSPESATGVALSTEGEVSVKELTIWEMGSIGLK